MPGKSVITFLLLSFVAVSAGYLVYQEALRTGVDPVAKPPVKSTLSLPYGSRTRTFLVTSSE